MLPAAPPHGALSLRLTVKPASSENFLGPIGSAVVTQYHPQTQARRTLGSALHLGGTHISQTNMHKFMKEWKDTSFGTWCSADWHSKTHDPTHLLYDERDSGSKDSPPHVSGPMSPRQKATAAAQHRGLWVVPLPVLETTLLQSRGDFSRNSVGKKKATETTL